MLVEHRTYTIAQGRMEEFLDLLRSTGWPALVDNLGDCLGFYVAEDNASVTHMWRYSDHADHEARRDRMLADPRFQEYAGVVESEGLITHIDARWLVPSDFSPTLSTEWRTA